MPAANVFLTWAGQPLKVLSVEYTCALGVSPSVAAIVAVPSDAAPALSGDLSFGTVAPAEALTLTDCYVAPNGFREKRSGAGRLWELFVQDRRWRWAIGPAIDGHYNQVDARGKFVPWTVRSPFQLATLLLERMGVSAPAAGWPSVIDLPGALALNDPANVPDVPTPGPFDLFVDPAADYLALGSNLAQYGSNPETIWVAVNAARALANLCDTYGRVVAFDPVTNTVAVWRMGQGAGLPAGAVLSQAPSVDPKSVPAELAVKGAPTRFQMRLAFRAVGKDWDDSWQPLSELTYAPARVGQKMVVAVADGSGDLVLNGVTFAGDAAGLAGGINSSTDPAVLGLVSAALAAGVLVLTGFAEGYEFEVAVSGGGSSPRELACTHGPVPADPAKGFEYLFPSFFPTVVPTPRLNFRQAMELAAQSVYRCFQLLPCDPAFAHDPFADDDDRLGIPVPGGADKIANRFRVILQSTRPDQTAPRPGDELRVDAWTGQPFAAETYNGYSKDRRPACFGSLWGGIETGGLWAHRDGLTLGNTPRRSAFFFDFQVVDPERQVVAFPRPLFRVLGGARAWPSGKKFPDAVTAGKAAILPADLVVETGCLLLDEFTYAPLRYEKAKTIPGGLGPTLTFVREDVQLETIGDYDARHALTGAHDFDADAKSRATYYLDAHALLFQLTGAAVNTYPGLQLIPMSGLVVQVSWRLDRSGVTTTGGANNEFSTVVVPYWARRRRENLAPDQQQTAENVRSAPAARAATRNAVAAAANVFGRTLPG